jgi:hypothetical protein
MSRHVVFLCFLTTLLNNLNLAILPQAGSAFVLSLPHSVSPEKQKA